MSKPTSMEQFFIQDEANGGVKFPLSLSDGTETDRFLMIRSQWSDAFQKALQEAHREDFEAAAKGEDIDPTERHVRLCAALVAGWNLDEEFTEENVKLLLRKNAKLRKGIDQRASNDARFFGKPSTDSTSGRKQK